MRDNDKIVIIQFNNNETTKVLGLKQLNLTGNDPFTITIPLPQNPEQR